MATNSCVQACTRPRSAKPPLVNARSRFSVDADWWYACTSRSADGTLAASVGVESLTMWPRKVGRSKSPTRSNAAVRGLANCPAMRPTFTTGHTERVRQHDGHLQDDAQLLADVDSGELLEALGAVAGL